MGILDDAIREHLELKRKHGVPEEEVERQEEEALGPARREVAQQPDDADIAAEEAAPTAATEDGVPSAGDESPLFDGEEPRPSVVEEHEPLAAAPQPDPHADEAFTTEPVVTEPLEEAPPFDEPEPAEPPVADHTGIEPPPADAPALGDTEPHGFPAVEDDEELDEEEEEAEDEDEEPDVLEDTPDFLQETPEHDRLWFEQKPPRDFDFD
jgi:hypothetical protein